MERSIFAPFPLFASSSMFVSAPLLVIPLLLSLGSIKSPFDCFELPSWSEWGTGVFCNVWRVSGKNNAVKSSMRSFLLFNELIIGEKEGMIKFYVKSKDNL